MERIREIAAGYSNLQGGSGDLRLKYLAFTGDRDAANAIAAEMDARPGGHMQLLTAVSLCHCGAPFDLEFTPNLAARLDEAGFDWPPPKVVDFPMKDW